MGCTSAKQVSAVPNGEEGQNKAYSNGDLLSGQSAALILLFPMFLFVQVVFHFLNILTFISERPFGKYKVFAAAHQ